MIKQFFGKEFCFLLAISVAIFLDAILAYAFNLGGWMLGLYFILFLVVAYKRLEWGIALVFLELFINPHGKLIFTTFAGQTIPLRMVLFAAVMLAWFLLFVQKRIRIDLTRMKPFIVLFIGVALGFVGLIANNPIDAFQDGNAYIYLLYLIPILSIEWNALSKRLLLQCLAAGSVWISFLSFGILYLYSHFSELQLEGVYLFLRDTRIADIADSLYRVFIQSQFFVIVFAVFLVALLFEKQEKKSSKVLMGLLAVSIAIVLLSLSRSFWVGIIMGLLTLFTLIILFIRPRFKEVISATGTLLISLVCSIAIISTIVFFPLPQRASNVELTNAFKERTSSDSAISSRWKLLDPMWKLIAGAPIVGNGFGTTVSFETDDPRIRSISPDGMWSTYSMEWGWHELWLKMGIFGPLGFVFLGMYLARSFIWQLKTDQRWVAVGFLTSIAFLFGTHIFSPYLNHPIGLGFLLLAFIFAEPLGGFPVSVLERVKVSIEQKKSAEPALTIKTE